MLASSHPVGGLVLDVLYEDSPVLKGPMASARQAGRRIQIPDRTPGSTARRRSLLACWRSDMSGPWRVSPSRPCRICGGCGFHTGYVCGGIIALAGRKSSVKPPSPRLRLIDPGTGPFDVAPSLLAPAALPTCQGEKDRLVYPLPAASARLLPGEIPRSNWFSGPSRPSVYICCEI